MKLLIAPTEDFIKKERTNLTADVSAGSNVALTVANNDQIFALDYIVIGYEGSEKAELQQVSSVSGGTVVTVGTLKFAHSSQEPITKYSYNKRKFYGSTTETGSYTELTGDGSPITIQVDDPQGTYLEYSGSTYAYFKSTYYNSQTTTETDIADAVAVQADETTRYAGIYFIRKHAGIEGNTYYSDLNVEDKRKQAENEINSSIFSRYTLPLSEIPAIITRICVLLAAGYIDFEEFGQDGEGVKWLGEARGLLKAIVDGRQRLIGADGTELAHNETTTALSGYPNATVGDTDSDSRVFKMSDKY